MSSKIYPDAASALAGLTADGITVMSGGFGLCGIPENLITALRDSGAKNLTVIGNNVGCDEHGMWLVLANNQIKKVLASYVGENKILETRFMNGEVEIEFNPQGTLAERIRAGGAGIPAFYTRTGYGTAVAEGKETRQFNGEWYVMETGLTADIALVKAWKADPEGNRPDDGAGFQFIPTGNLALAEHVNSGPHEVHDEREEGDADDRKRQRTRGQHPGQVFPQRTI